MSSKRMTVSLLAGLFLVSLPVGTMAQGRAPATNKPFPLQLYPQIGKKGLTSIAEFRGKKLLLIQFASW